MKKLIIHSVSIIISFIWLVVECGTINPVTLKGPDFLKFYMTLVLGFYLSVFMLKLLGETISQTTFYFLMLIGGLGIIKLIRGMMLGKPIGFLMMILTMELIVLFLLLISKSGNKIKK